LFATGGEHPTNGRTSVAIAKTFANFSGGR
jgi:hypothetical protein